MPRFRVGAEVGKRHAVLGQHLGHLGHVKVSVSQHVEDLVREQLLRIALDLARPEQRLGRIDHVLVEAEPQLRIAQARRRVDRLTRRFPELAAAVAALEPPTLLLDGEIAVFDSRLVSHFEWLRERPKGETATPLTLIVFDLP